MTHDRRTIDIAASAGLAVGAAFGLAGTLVTDPPVRQVLWVIDGVALIVAAALLVVRFLRTGHELVAAGFLVFAIGESLLVGGNAAGLVAGVPLFGGGVALWAAALLLVSIPPVFASWARVTGFIAAALFAIVAGRIAWGEPLGPTASPLPFFAYPFLVLTFVGWMQALLTGGLVRPVVSREAPP